MGGILFCLSDREEQNYGSKQKNSWNNRNQLSKEYCDKPLQTKQLGEFKICIQQQNILFTDVDCMVLLQDDTMSFIGKTGRNIKKLAGKELMEECKLEIAKHGRLKEGLIYQTHAGNLNFEYILHVNIPPISSKMQEVERAFIFDIIQKVLDSCFSDLQLDSVSIPLLINPSKEKDQSADYQQLVACIMLQSIKIYIEQQQQKRELYLEQQFANTTPDFDERSVYMSFQDSLQSEPEIGQENHILNDDVDPNNQKAPQDNSIFISNDSNQADDNNKNKSEHKIQNLNFKNNKIVKQNTIKNEQNICEKEGKETLDAQIIKSKKKQNTKHYQINDREKKINLVGLSEQQTQIFIEEFYDVFTVGAPVNLRKSMVKTGICNTESVDNLNNNWNQKYLIKMQNNEQNQESDENEEEEDAKIKEYYQYQQNNNQNESQIGQFYRVTNDNYISSMNISDIFEMTPNAMKMKSKRFQNKQKGSTLEIDGFQHQLSL